MTERKMCDNCSRAAAYLRLRLLQLGRRLGSLRAMEKRAEGRPSTSVSMASIKVAEEVDIHRLILEIVEPAPTHYTGVFPGKGRKKIKAARKRKDGHGR